jgi:hypothetical protein
LIAGNVPKPPYDSILEGDPTDALTGLLYNTDPAKGRSILYTNRIEKALLSGDSAAISELSKGKGFDTVLSNVLAPSVGGWNDPRALLNAVFAIVESGALRNYSWLAPRTRAFCRRALNADWPLLDTVVARNVAALVTLLNGPDDIRQLLARANAAPRSMIGTNFTEEQITRWTEGVMTLAEQIRNTGQEAVLAEGIWIPGTARNFVQASQILGSHQDLTETYWAFLRTSVEGEKIIDVICANRETSWTEQQAAATRVLQSLRGIKLPWHKFVSSATTVIHVGGVQPDVGTVARLLESLWLVRDGTADSEIDSLVRGGHIHHHFARAMDEKNYVAASAMAAAIFVKSTPDRQPPQTGAAWTGFTKLNEVFRNPQEYDEFVRAFTKNVADQRWSEPFNHLLEHSARTKLFVQRTLMHAATHPHIGLLLAPRYLVDNYNRLVPILEDSDISQTVFTSLANTDGYLAEFAKAEFRADHCELYLRLGNAQGFTDVGFVGWCDAGLRAITRAQWLQQFHDAAHALRLLIALRQKSPGLYLEDPYLDAFREYAEELIRGTGSVPDLADEWDYLFGALQSDDRQLLRRRLRDSLLESDGPGGSFFEIFGDELATDRSILVEDKGVLRNLFTPLLENQSQAGLKWLIKVLSQHPKVLDDFPDADRKDFVGRAATAYKSKTDDAKRGQLERLASLAGVNLANQETVKR